MSYHINNHIMIEFMIEFMIDLGFQTQTALDFLKASVWLFSLLLQCQSQYGIQFCQEWAATKNISLLRPSEKVLTKAIIPTATVLLSVYSSTQSKYKAPIDHTIDGNVTYAVIHPVSFYHLEMCPCPHNILRDATCFGHCGSRRSHPVASQSCYRNAPSERTQTKTVNRKCPYLDRSEQ